MFFIFKIYNFLDRYKHPFLCQNNYKLSGYWLTHFQSLKEIGKTMKQYTEGGTIFLSLESPFTQVIVLFIL